MGTGKSICIFLFVLRERGTSYPPTVTTTEGHESEQDTCNNNGGGCRAHAFAMPRTGAGHVAELCQDGDDARCGRYGLPAGRAVLQRPGIPDSLSRVSISPSP